MRIYTLTVASVVVISTAVTMFVLAGLIPDSRALRITLAAGLVLILLSLLTRIALDILWATATAPQSAEQFEEAPGAAPGSAAPPRAENGIDHPAAQEDGPPQAPP